MGTFGITHWIIVLAIVLLLFGNRLPSTMRSLGRGVTEFKKGLEGGGDDDEELDRPKKKKPSAEIEDDDDRPRKKSSAEAEGNGSAKDEKTEKAKEH